MFTVALSKCQGCYRLFLVVINTPIYPTWIITVEIVEFTIMPCCSLWILYSFPWLYSMCFIRVTWGFEFRVVLLLDWLLEYKDSFLSQGHFYESEHNRLQPEYEFGSLFPLSATWSCVPNRSASTIKLFPSPFIPRHTHTGMGLIWYSTLIISKIIFSLLFCS